MLINVQQIKKQIPYKIMRVQEAGSVAWGYSRPSSDHDILVVYEDDPVENLFSKHKPSLLSTDKNITYIICRWSDFISQVLKFNLNYYCYLWSDEVYYSSSRVNKLRRLYTDLLRDNFSIQMKLTVQAVSCIESYYKKDKTYKDLYRIAYMYWLALRFKELPRSVVDVKWDGRGDNLIYETYKMYKRGLDGDMDREAKVLHQKIYETGRQIRMPQFELPRIELETYCKLFRG